MRSLLFIGALMCFSVSGQCFKFKEKHGYLSIDLVRHKSAREQILSSWQYGVDKEQLLGNGTRTNDTISLKRYLDNEFYGEIVIGKPGQTMYVAFDTAWHLSWVISKKCQNFISPACDVHRQYDNSRSSYYKPNGTKYDAGVYSGFYSYENISIAHSNVTGFLFVEMTKIPNDFMTEKADGVLGLGLAPSDGSYEPFFYTLYRQKKIKNNLFCIYLNRDPSSKKGGSINLGFIDDKHIKKTVQPDGTIKPDEITYLNVEGNDILWQFRMDKVVVGQKGSNYTLCKDGCNTTVDSTTNKITGPKQDIDYIRDKTNAKQNGDTWQVDCSQVRKLPKIGFVLGGKEFIIGGPQYILKMSNVSETICVLALESSDMDVYQDMWILGGAFLSTHYTVYNIEERKIGFVRTP